VAVGTPSGGRAYVRCVVYLDDRKLAAMGVAKAGELVALHELGHLVGLEHLPDTKQVRYPSINVNLAGYAAGGPGRARRPRPRAPANPVSKRGTTRRCARGGPGHAGPSPRLDVHSGPGERRFPKEPNTCIRPARGDLVQHLPPAGAAMHQASVLAEGLPVPLLDLLPE